MRLAARSCFDRGANFTAPRGRATRSARSRALKGGRGPLASGTLREMVLPFVGESGEVSLKWQVGAAANLALHGSALVARPLTYRND